jgi:hypothetical protein
MTAGPPSAKPEELRPILHEKIDKLAANDLPLVHRVLLQLEAERLAAEITDGLEKDPKFFDQIDDTITEYRKKHPYR